MLGTTRRQAANVQVRHANVDETRTPHTRTLASWFPNLFKKEKENAYEQHGVQEKANDLHTTVKPHPCSKKLKVPKQPKDGYVISKPVALHRDSDDNIRTVLVDHAIHSPAHVHDVSQTAHDEGVDCSAAVHDTYVKPVSPHPNRRNLRRPPIFGEFRPGHRTTYTTVAPQAGSVRRSSTFGNIAPGPWDESPRTSNMAIVEAMSFAPEIPAAAVEQFASVMSTLPSPIEEIASQSNGFMCNRAEEATSSLPRHISTPAEIHAAFDQMQQRADEEYERRMAGGLYARSVTNEEELAYEANAETGLNCVQGQHQTWEELKEIADREYEERLNHTTISEVPSISPSTVASISAASADARVSVADELSEVDWDEWRHNCDGDGEHQRERENAPGGAAPPANKTKKPSRSGARRTAPRVVARVARFFRIGKDLIRFLSGGPVITPFATLR
ncbi:hypothetical protein FRB97_006394 [Tulasnella sp. 331]|nr:hypothetical protein FRB97_006394 [Tulasnella sp. 331]